MAERRNPFQMAIGATVRSPGNQFLRNTTFSALESLGVGKHVTNFGRYLTGGVQGDVMSTLPEQDLKYIKTIIHNRDVSQAALSAATERLKRNPSLSTVHQYRGRKGNLINQSAYNKLNKLEQRQYRFSGNKEVSAQDLATAQLEKMGYWNDSALGGRGKAIDFTPHGSIRSYDYDVPSSLRNTLGQFSYNRDVKGNLNITDRWEVNQSNASSDDRPYRAWWGEHSDLPEGTIHTNYPQLSPTNRVESPKGKLNIPLASRAYDIANALGTSRPFDIKVSSPYNQLKINRDLKRP